MPLVRVASFSLVAWVVSSFAIQPHWIQFPGIARPQTVPYRAADLGKPLQLKLRIEPVVPKTPPRSAAERLVALELIINERGEVWSASATSGPEFLHAAALEAVRQWRYEPVSVAGKPVPVLARVTLDFRASRVFGGPGSPPRRPPIHVGSNVQQANRIFHVAPAYPDEAFRNRIAGSVVLQVKINEEGDVCEARVLRGHPLVIAAVADAVRQWRYRPMLLNGEPVPVITIVTVEFDFRR